MVFKKKEGMRFDVSVILSEGYDKTAHKIADSMGGDYPATVSGARCALRCHSQMIDLSKERFGSAAHVEMRIDGKIIPKDILWGRSYANNSGDAKELLRIAQGIAAN